MSRTLFEIIVDAPVGDDKQNAISIGAVGHLVNAGQRSGNGHGVEWKARSIGDDEPPNPGHHKGAALAEFRAEFVERMRVYGRDPVESARALSDFDAIVTGYTTAPTADAACPARGDASSATDEPTKSEGGAVTERSSEDLDGDPWNRFA